MNKRLIITLGIALVLVLSTLLAIKFAKGYRFNLKDQELKGNGLLVINSDPKGASVFINGKLKTATDDTIHLNPDVYDIRIEKEGYSSWQKDIIIEKELVSQTNAKLFPNVPDLSALTLNGASNPTPSPDGHKIAFKIATGSAKEKYGIWILNLDENPLRFGSSTVQIAKDSSEIKFSQAQLFWNPNSNEILAYFNEDRAYLLNTNIDNKPNNLINVSFQMSLTLQDWQKQLTLEREKRLVKLPIKMQEIATKSATLLFFSPNEEKLLYTATNSAQIPENLISPIIAINSQKQDRQLESGNVYIYDSKEDTNFLIDKGLFSQEELAKIIEVYSPPLFVKEDLEQLSTATPNPYRNPIDIQKPILSELVNLQGQYSPIYTPLKYQWFPDSYHLIKNIDSSINILEYDGYNNVIVYTGFFQENFVYPWPNGQQLMILTSLTTDPKVLSNLYAINLK